MRSMDGAGKKKVKGISEDGGVGYSNIILSAPHALRSRYTLSADD